MFVFLFRNECSLFNPNTYQHLYKANVETSIFAFNTAITKKVRVLIFTGALSVYKNESLPTMMEYHMCKQQVRKFMEKKFFFFFLIRLLL